MAKLYFYHGTMYSGKSIDLLKSAHNYSIQGKKTLLFTSDKDNRAKELNPKDLTSFITTRFGENEEIKVSREAYLIERVDFYNMISSEKPDCVFVDEVQFISKDIIFKLAEVVDILDIPVVCYGLKNDSNLNLFPGSEALINISNKILETKTICSFCKNKALFNLRTETSDGKEVQETLKRYSPVFGGGQIVTEIKNVRYFPVCRKCYMGIKHKQEKHNNVIIINFKVA